MKCTTPVMEYDVSMYNMMCNPMTTVMNDSLTESINLHRTGLVCRYKAWLLHWEGFDDKLIPIHQLSAWLVYHAVNLHRYQSLT